MSKDTQASFNDCLHLMIASEMARIYGLNQAGRVRKLARKIRDRTKDTEMHKLAKGIVKSSDKRVIDGLVLLHDEMKKDGII